jgi:hypothetical protein
MTRHPSEHLRDCARRLVFVLNARDLNHPVLSETVARLGPLINESLGEQKNLLSRLPGSLFSVHATALTTRHLRDTELATAIRDFEKAMSAIGKRESP